MAMNRRNVLIGLGAVAAGGGAAIGTGAFSQVEASRTVSASTTGDGGAYVSFTNTDGAYVDTSGGSNSNQLQFTFEKLNEDAISKFDGLLDISVNPPDAPSNSNAISDTYHIYVRSETNVGNSAALDVEDDSDTTLVGSDNAQSIAHSGGNWESISNVGVRIDDSNYDISNIPSAITFVVTDTQP